MDIHEMRSELRTVLDQMDDLSDTANDEDRDFTDDEQAKYDELDARAKSLEKRVKREEDRRERRDKAPLPEQHETRTEPRATRVEARDYDGTDFRSLGEFTQAVILNPRDQRLRGQFVETREEPQYEGLEMQTPSAGGYLVPEQFMSEILQFSARGAIIRPRARVIGAGSSPDAKVSIPVLDQSGDKGVYSGVQVDWIEEGGLKPETAPSFDQISFEPHEVAAHTFITDKELRNAPIVENIVRDLLTGGIFAAEDVAFIGGNGNGKPTGFIGHASNIEVARASVNDVTYADLVEMYSRMIFGGSPVWLVTQRAVPRLMHIEDSEGHLIWQPSLRESVPATILGFPVVVSNRLPGLGGTGDISFVDLSYYIIKDGTGLALAASEHVQFLNNRTVIKAFKLVDGRPWPNTPLQDENGENVSPFVVLDDPEGDGDGGDA